MGILFANHAKSVAVAAVLPEDDLLICSLDGVATYPDIINDDDYFYVSAIPPGKRDFTEIIKVTSLDKETGEIGVVRGADGTEPVPHLAGTKLEIRIPAAVLRDIMNAGLAGPKPVRHVFDTPAREWIVIHNRSTTMFDENIWVHEDDDVHRKHMAAIEILDAERFKICFSCAVSGYVDIRF
jgi:hypothetical protein